MTNTAATKLTSIACNHHFQKKVVFLFSYSSYIYIYIYIYIHYAKQSYVFHATFTLQNIFITQLMIATKNENLSGDKKKIAFKLLIIITMLTLSTLSNEHQSHIVFITHKFI